MSDITKLREHLFSTLQGLKNGKITPEKARAINETAQVIVNTAKVEVDYCKATTQTTGSKFFPELGAPSVPTLTDRNQPSATGTSHVTPVPGGNVINHRMR